MKYINLIAQTDNGVAHIDMKEAKRLNISVATTRGGSNAVAELIFGLILAFPGKRLGKENHRDYRIRTDRE